MDLVQLLFEGLAIDFMGLLSVDLVGRAGMSIVISLPGVGPTAVLNNLL